MADLGPQNAILGNEFGIDIPETQVDNTELIEEKKAARFSKTAEYRKLKEYVYSRIDFHQKRLPNGGPITDVMSDAERGQRWAIANEVITELKAITDAYEQAAETVKESKQ